MFVRGWTTRQQPHICEQDGRHPLLEADASLPVVAFVVSLQRNNTLSRIPSRCTEHCGRQRIADGLDLTVETRAQHVPEYSGPLFSGLVCQFATCLNHQLPRYVSWRPDPFAMAMDTFSLSWQGLQGFAFLPFALLGKCLQKIREKGSTVQG